MVFNHKYICRQLTDKRGIIVDIEKVIYLCFLRNKHLFDGVRAKEAFKYSFDARISHAFEEVLFGLIPFHSRGKVVILFMSI